MKKRVLITGGAGFIGSWLCDRFHSENFEVITLDNLLTGNIKNIEHLFGREGFVFLEHDVTDYIHVPGPLDFILHFASPASPIDYLELPIQTLKVGALGTHKVLGLAKAKKARLLLASTSEVYGDPLEHPQKESYWGNVNPIGPRGVYDEAKRFAEALTMAYHRYHGVETRIARIFNTYGPRMRLHDGRAIPNFINQALRGEKITVFGSGNQTRSFCYISDLVEGICRLLFSEKPGIEEPVNLGNPEEMTVLDLARRTIQMIPGKGDAEGRIEFKPLPEDDPRVRKPDISRAQKLLSWNPGISLEQGLRQTIGYFSEQFTRESKSNAKSQ
ncbi:MAG: SDR family oxidoreductase [Proteobacteria bacterium]|nr:SDR family oxidoreductase [Pseudomonadota bacterium]